MRVAVCASYFANVYIFAKTNIKEWTMTDYVVQVLVTLFFSGLIATAAWLLKTNPELLAGYNRLTEEQRRPERLNKHISALE